MGFPLHDKALAYAASQLGVHEDPMGSNRGTRVEFYQRHDFLAGGGYPWCASFTLTCWEEGAGHPLPYKSAGAYDLYNWAKREGWSRPSKECIPGDLIVFNIGSGHIG